MRVAENIVRVLRSAVVVLTLIGGVAGGPATAESVTGETVTREAGTMAESPNKYRKPDESVLRQKLSPEEFAVTQRDGTEAPFRNRYWDNHAPGIYVDVVSGEPLFSSLDKFDSGTGWPSFTKPIGAERVTQRTDTKLFMTRTEVRSAGSDSHLGHVFDDGPGPEGTRYCINSAALRFVPAEKLAEEGYVDYIAPFVAAGVLPESSLQSVAGPQAKSSTPATVVREERVVLAGGCFWGMEELLRKLPGVKSTRVGYSGGGVANPVYEQVSTGTTGHAESVEVVFDPTILTFEALLTFYFRIHDPTTPNRQGNDRGTQYRSAIFVTSEEQRREAERFKERLDASKKWSNPVVTQIAPAGEFYPAEEYHQRYLEKNPGGYTCHYLRPE